jgi:hypothetical protein
VLLENECHWTAPILLRHYNGLCLTVLLVASDVAAPVCYYLLGEHVLGIRTVWHHQCYHREFVFCGVQNKVANEVAMFSSVLW